MHGRSLAIDTPCTYLLDPFTPDVLLCSTLGWVSIFTIVWLTTNLIRSSHWRTAGWRLPHATLVRKTQDPGPEAKSNYVSLLDCHLGSQGLLYSATMMNRLRA